MNPRTPRVLPIAALFLLAATHSVAQVTTRNLELKAHFNQYPPVAGSPFSAGYAACWSYVHPQDGREYAVIGTTNGTAIYNVTDPDNAYFVKFIPGPVSAWHEMKSYRNWIYVVSEGAGGGTQPAPGVQIIRMTNPEIPVLAATYATGFNRSHTVSVDTTRALLICNGTNAGSWGGMRILSLANPEAPVQLSSWGAGAPDTYVHDSVPVGNRLYASSINSGEQRVLDITNPSAPFEISSWTYMGWTGPEGAFTHNAWPDATGNYLYVTDEVQGEPLKIFDISNVLAPVMVNAITSNPRATVHNAHVLGDELYLSNYTEGIRILDLSDPAHPAEFAWADSYPGPSGGFFGVWEVCPYFPSGTVIASDMQTGLYVYRPVRDYGILRAEVVNASTQMPMKDVPVFLTTQGDSLRTPEDGIVQFAPSPGTHTVAARRFGYEVAEATRVVSVGSRDTFRLEMVLKPSVEVDGTIRDANTFAALDDADISLAYTPVRESSNSLGNYHLHHVPEDLYRVEILRPGYVPATVERRIGPGYPTTLDYHLQSTTTWDALEVASGWSVGAPGDDATTGQWVRVEPLGTGMTSAGPNATGPAERRAGATAELPVGRLPGLLHDSPEQPSAPGEIQPEFDRTPPPGLMCFVTGQGTNPNAPGEADVDNGRTSLTTPALNLSTMSDPMIGYWRWFYTNGDNNDWLAVLISNNNGASFVAVDTLRGLHNHWHLHTFRVADFVTPTSQVRVRFVAADLGGGSLVEAAIDDFVTYEASAPNTPVDVTPIGQPRRMRFASPRPNPSRGIVHLSLELPAVAKVEVEILDLMGRSVRTLHRGEAAPGVLALRWDGSDKAGRRAPTGLYYVRARAEDQQALTRFVRVN